MTGIYKVVFWEPDTAFWMLPFSHHRNPVMWALTVVPFADEDSRGPRACSSHKRVKSQGLSPTLPKAYPHMLLRSRERMNGGSSVVQTPIRAPRAPLQSHYHRPSPYLLRTSPVPVWSSQGSWEVSSLHFHQCYSFLRLPRVCYSPEGKNSVSMQIRKTEKKLNTIGYWLAFKPWHNNTFYKSVIKGL